MENKCSKKITTDNAAKTVNVGILAGIADIISLPLLCCHIPFIYLYMQTSKTSEIYFDNSRKVGIFMICILINKFAKEN